MYTMKIINIGTYSDEQKDSGDTDQTAPKGAV